jgi:hypothetical protein
VTLPDAVLVPHHLRRSKSVTHFPRPLANGFPPPSLSSERTGASPRRPPTPSTLASGPGPCSCIPQPAWEVRIAEATCGSHYVRFALMLSAAAQAPTPDEPSSAPAQNGAARSAIPAATNSQQPLPPISLKHRKDLPESPPPQSDGDSCPACPVAACRSPTVSPVPSTTDTAIRPFYGCNKRWYLYRRESVLPTGSMSTQRCPTSKQPPSSVACTTETLFSCSVVRRRRMRLTGRLAAVTPRKLAEMRTE